MSLHRNICRLRTWRRTTVTLQSKHTHTHYHSRSQLRFRFTREGEWSFPLLTVSRILAILFTHSVKSNSAEGVKWSVWKIPSGSYDKRKTQNVSDYFLKRNLISFSKPDTISLCCSTSGIANNCLLIRQTLKLHSSYCSTSILRMAWVSI